MTALFLPAWRYRNFILSSIKNEFMTRFVRSRLGGLWIALNPLAQVAIYALILSAVMKAKISGVDNKYAYAIYLMAGMLAWSLFTEVFGRCTSIFIDNRNLIKKIAFPKIALPLIVTGSALINNLALFTAMFIVFGALGHLPSLTTLWLAPLTVLTLGIAIGLGLSLGIINVFIRDIGQAVPIILQFWFWLTPVVYRTEMLPEEYRGLLLLNPITGIVMSYQNILVYSKSPDISVLLYPVLIAALMLGISLYLYQRASNEMADAL
ncbi:MAG: ABC transporter permease [Sedimenticola sp.]